MVSDMATRQRAAETAPRAEVWSGVISLHQL
jgi:hypothetical protein